MGEGADARPDVAAEEALEAEEESVEGASTERLKAFSDGVFSIAITLLVLELKVPPVEETAGRTMTAVLTALLKEWPVFVAYLLGFITIGVMWANHCVLFRYITRTNHKLVALNTLLLLVISLTPFTTALLAPYVSADSAHAQAATLVYSGHNFLMALAFNALWRYAVRRPRQLLDRKLDPRLYDVVTARYRYGPHIYAAAFALAFVSVPLSLGLVGALAMIYALPYEPRALSQVPFLRGRR